MNRTVLLSYTLELYTDAAQYLGYMYASVYKDMWFYGAFPSEWQILNIMTLEFYPIILALHMCGPLWKIHSILFFTDNEALESVINKQTSRVNEVIRTVRYMVLQCLNLNILFKAKHIHVPGNKNIFADCLSRLQVDQFLKLAAHAKKNQAMCQASCCHRTYGVHWGLNTICIASLYSKYLQTCMDYF